MNRKFQKALARSLPFYLLTGLLVLGIKYYYSKASCSQLLWILAPTCQWVRILSGLSFDWMPDVGYISHQAHFIIAGSCSGIQFMIISIAALDFSFLHRRESRKQAGLWMVATAAISYVYTVFVNGLRILLSIYLPLLLDGHVSFGGWLTKERFHSMIGIAVYFTALLILYQFADECSLPASGKTAELEKTGKPARAAAKLLSKYMVPLFWYFFIVLGLPLLNGALRQNGQGFRDYARLITAVCLGLLSIFGLLYLLRSRFRKNE